MSLGLFQSAHAQINLSTGLSISATVASGDSGTGDTGGGTSGGGSSGGGGGGGGFNYFSTATVHFAGRAYPSSQVLVLKDGVPLATTTAGPDAAFAVTLSGVASGSANFVVVGIDAFGRRSDPISFPLIVTPGVTIDISGIFVAPTIALDKSQVVQGDTLTIFGQSIPASTVVISVHSSSELLHTVKTDSSGAYLYKLDTTPLAIGSHTAKSKTKAEDDISPYSNGVDFTVAESGTAEVPVTTIVSDFNTDGHVNFVDYSIMAYWYKKYSPPADVDLNHDGHVDLIDFSILAYYWTG